MNVDAAEQLADGSGIRVGIVADGIDPNNPDLIRANGQHVIFDYEDFSGAGTNAPTDGREAFLDAGTIASQANQTYDLSGFVNPAHPLPPGCNIKIKGIAPGASLAVMNLSGPNAGFFNSTIIQGIQWAVMHDHVNILNESIGGNPLPNTEDDPVALADEAAIAAGVIVVARSGDAGPFNNIGSPATTPGVIAAGGTADLPRVPADHPLRDAALSRRLGGQQHHGAELGRHRRVQPRHRRRRGPGRPRLVAVQQRHDEVLRLRRHRPRQQPAADLGGRRHQRIRPGDLRHRGARAAGVREDAWRASCRRRPGQADHRQHGPGPRRAGRPPGRGPRQHAEGRAAGQVDRRRQQQGNALVRQTALSGTSTPARRTLHRARDQ